MLQDDSNDSEVRSSIDETYELSIYPNPSSGDIQLDNREAGHLFIYDLSGKMVSNSFIATPNGNVQLDLPANLYIAKFVSQDTNTIHHSRIVIAN